MTMRHVLIEGHGLARRIERIAPLEPRHTRALIQGVIAGSATRPSASRSR